MALMTYDAAGNLLQDGSGTGSISYQWDAEGRMVSASVNGGSATTYVYNALGQRVSKTVGSTYTGMVYDPFGQLMEYNNGHAETEDFMYLNGRPIAAYTSGTRFLHATGLGSTAIVTDQAGNETQDELYYPWGQRWTSLFVTDDERFAGLQKRDAETGLDPTQFRIMSSTQGRWLSPDPLAGDISNPQSLNRYAYVLNNPTNFIDPLGLDCATDFPGQSCIDSTSTAPFLPESGFSLSTIFCFMGFGDCGGSTQTQSYPTATPPASTNGNSGGSTPVPAAPPGSKGSGCGIQRAALAAKGVLSLGVAGVKVRLLVGSALAVPATGGASGLGVAYGAIGAAGNVAAGGIQFVGAATGKVTDASQAASAVSTVTTVAGFIVFVATRGNMEQASAAATIESIGTAGFNGGATGQLVDEGATFVQNLLLSTEKGQSVLDALGLGGTGACHE